ncbi:hypothetical protein GGF31_003801 [Allomyces arbusculus]|nr:hypothetical protein GGF31_003801 [Allomyces arbusculus]
MNMNWLDVALSTVLETAVHDQQVQKAGTGHDQHDSHDSSTMGTLNATTAAPNSRTAHSAITGTKTESLHGADTFAAGRNILAARAASASPAAARAATSTPASDSTRATTTVPTTSAWNPHFARASADAEEIDRALTNASNELKALIVQVLTQDWNCDARRSLVACAKEYVRADLETAFASYHGEKRVDVDLVVWRMEHARAAVAAKVIRVGCHTLCKHWDRQLTVFSGSSAESDTARRLWLDSAVQALRDVADRYDQDLTVHKKAVDSEDPFRVLFSIIARDETRNRDVEALVSTVEAVATHMANVLSKTFQLSVSWDDFMGLIRRVALPLVECFLLTKALDPNWDIEFVLPGTPFSSATMVDPPLEVELRVDERSPPTCGHGVSETKVVVINPFPGIPMGPVSAELGNGAVTQHVHISPSLEPPAPVVTCAADMSALVSDLYRLVTEPILLNLPRGEISVNSLHASRIRMVSGTINRFLSLFDRTLTGPHTDLHHELAMAKRRAAQLRADLAQATTAGRVSAHVRAILADHEHDILWTLDFPAVPPAETWWTVPFVHNQWFQLVLTARVAGYVLVMPRPGDEFLGQIKCLVHNEAWECGLKVGTALFPNLAVFKQDEKQMAQWATNVPVAVPDRIEVEKAWKQLGVPAAEVYAGKAKRQFVGLRRLHKFPESGGLLEVVQVERIAGCHEVGVA